MSNETLTTFKKNALRAQAYLQESGIPVTHAVLLEALARFEGHRDYRTLKAQARKKTIPKVQAPQVLAPDECFYVLVETFGDGSLNPPSNRPDCVAFRVTQAALDKLFEADQISKEKHVDLDGEFIDRHYLGTTWRFGYDEVTVSRGAFFCQGEEKYSESKFETNSVQLLALLPALEEARRVGAKLIFWDFSEEAVENTLDNIRCTEEAVEAEADEDQVTELLDSVFDEETLAKRICWNKTYISSHQPE